MKEKVDLSNQQTGKWPCKIPKEKRPQEWWAGITKVEQEKSRDMGTCVRMI